MSNGDVEVTTIPKIRNVIYDTYANFPVTGLSAGDLAFATDRLVLYRWSGAAWQNVTFYCFYGTAGAIPVAATLPNGSVYYETDTTITKQVQAGAWVTIVLASSAFSAHIVDFTLHEKIVRKTADETVNNSIALQNDDHLLFAIGANEVWDVTLMLLVTTPSVTPFFKIGWSYPASCLMFWGLPSFTSTAAATQLFGTSGSTAPTALIQTGTAVTGLGAGSTKLFFFRAIVINGANAGNINLQWAQNVATVEDTKVLTNSFLSAHKLN